MWVELGNYFIVKFEGMFKDMEFFKDLLINYKDYICNFGDDDRKFIEFVIYVFIINFWFIDVMGCGVF